MHTGKRCTEYPLLKCGRACHLSNKGKGHRESIALCRLTRKLNDMLSALNSVEVEQIEFFSFVVRCQCQLILAQGQY